VSVNEYSDNNDIPAERTAKIGMAEKLGYGLGDAGFNFYWIIIGSYLLYFYTDIYGLAPATAGVMFLVTKIIDACTDPVMGAIADRTQSRWGKFRPYLLFGALPMAAAAVLTMSTPDLGETGKTVWAYATYSFMMLCYTILSTPYSSLSGVLTADTRERNSIFGIRFFFAYFTGILVGAFTPDLADYFGQGNPEKGWRSTMILYSVVATLCFWVTFASTRERVRPTNVQQSNPVTDIRDLLNNPAWVVLFVLAMIIMITLTLRGSSAAYYFKYFVERPDLMGIYIGVQMTAYCLGAAATPLLTARMDKTRLLIILMSVVGVLSLAFTFIPKPAVTGVMTVDVEKPVVIEAEKLLGELPGDIESYQWLAHKKVFWIFTTKDVLPETGEQLLLTKNVRQTISVRAIYRNKQGEQQILDSAVLPREIAMMFLLNILISLALGPKSPLTWSMYADTADYNEWRTGRRATAMTFSAATFSQKLGGALGSAVIGVVLAAIGYTANQAQSNASQFGIVLMQTAVPGAFAFVAVFALRFYTLTNEKLEIIQQELSQRDRS